MALITGVGGSANNFFYLKCSTYLRARRLGLGNAYLSKYSIPTVKIMSPFPLDSVFITPF